VVRGLHDDEEVYRKSATVQLWLFGLEFPETLLVFTKDSLIIATSPTKGIPPMLARSHEIQSVTPVMTL
jgi:nucleosome binding factor SPN SPT16 subunit